MHSAVEIILGILKIFYRIFEHWFLLCIPTRLRYKDVRNDVVLITGGGSGMGRSLAQIFGHLGSKVVIWDVNREGNEETRQLARKNESEVKGYVVDVTDRKQVYDTALKVKRDVGEVTILINNAGIVYGKKLMDLADDGIEKIFQVNTISHFWTCKAFLPDMMSRNYGHVVNVASVAGHAGCEQLIDYCATKHSVVGFSDSLAAELNANGYDGIKVTTVSPAMVNTGLFEGLNSGLIPPLETDEAARKIADAILTNQSVAHIPWYLSFIIMMKALLPTEAFTALCEILGSKGSMKNFRGRPTTFNKNSNLQ